MSWQLFLLIQMSKTNDLRSDNIYFKKNRSLKFGIRCYDTKYTTLDSNMVFFMANPYLWRKSNKKQTNTTLVYQAIPPKHTFPAPYLHTWVKKSLGRTMNSPDRLTKDSKKAGNSELLFWAWTEVMWWWSLARDLWVSSHPPSYSHHRPLQKMITVQPFSRSMVPEPLLYTEVYLFGSTQCPALAQIPSPPVTWCSTSPKTNVLQRIHRPRTPRLSTTLPKESIVIQMSELLWKVFLNKGTSLNSLNRNTNCSFHSYPL